MRWMGNEGVDAELAFEPHQHGFLQILAGGGDGQEVRFVDHDEMFVLVQDNLVEGDARFCL